MVGKIRVDNWKSVFKGGLDGVSSIVREQMIGTTNCKSDTRLILAILLSPLKILPNCYVSSKLIPSEAEFCRLFALSRLSASTIAAYIFAAFVCQVAERPKA